MGRQNHLVIEIPAVPFLGGVVFLGLLDMGSGLAEASVAAIGLGLFTWVCEGVLRRYVWP